MPQCQKRPSLLYLRLENEHILESLLAMLRILLIRHWHEEARNVDQAQLADPQQCYK